MVCCILSTTISTLDPGGSFCQFLIFPFPILVFMDLMPVCFSHCSWLLFFLYWTFFFTGPSLDILPFYNKLHSVIETYVWIDCIFCTTIFQSHNFRIRCPSEDWWSFLDMCPFLTIWQLGGILYTVGVHCTPSTVNSHFFRRCV